MDRQGDRSVISRDYQAGGALLAFFRLTFLKLTPPRAVQTVLVSCLMVQARIHRLRDCNELACRVQGAAHCRRHGSAGRLNAPFRHDRADRAALAHVLETPWPLDADSAIQCRSR